MPEQQTKPYFLLLLGSALVLLPLLFAFRWFYIVYGGGGSDDQRIAEFGAIFPGTFQFPVVSSLFALIFSLASTVVGFGGSRQFYGMARRLFILLFTLGTLLSLWLLFMLA